MGLTEVIKRIGLNAIAGANINKNIPQPIDTKGAYFGFKPILLITSVNPITKRTAGIP